MIAQVFSDQVEPRFLKMSATPPTMPATWNTSAKYIPSHSQSSHETRNLGPGTVFIASSVVIPRKSAKRPNSICTNTLITHPRMMNQSNVNPTLAPSLGVTITSPDPTIEAVTMSPGPVFFKISVQRVGAIWASD